jgi:hypothetical protein
MNDVDTRFIRAEHMDASPDAGGLSMKTVSSPLLLSLIEFPPPPHADSVAERRTASTSWLGCFIDVAGLVYVLLFGFVLALFA